MRLNLLYVCFAHTLFLASSSTAPLGPKVSGYIAEVWFWWRGGAGNLLQIVSLWSPLLGEIQHLY